MVLYRTMVKHKGIITVDLLRVVGNGSTMVVVFLNRSGWYREQ